jgi:hypothetical protein
VVCQEEGLKRKDKGICNSVNNQYLCMASLIYLQPAILKLKLEEKSTAFMENHRVFRQAWILTPAPMLYCGALHKSVASPSSAPSFITWI